MSEYVTKRISLPGGQVVDIVYFSEAVAAEAGATRREPARARALSGRFCAFRAPVRFQRGSRAEHRFSLGGRSAGSS